MAHMTIPLSTEPTERADRPTWTGRQLVADPTRITSRPEFAAALTALMGITPINVVVGRSESRYRQRIHRGEQNPRLPPTRALLAFWLSGRSLPKTQEAVMTLLAAAGAQPHTFSDWLDAWDRARTAPQSQQP